MRCSSPRQPMSKTRSRSSSGIPPQPSVTARRTRPSVSRSTVSFTVSAGLGMTDRVADQVRHRAGQLVRVTVHREPIVVRRRRHLQRDTLGPGVLARLPRHVLGQLPQADRRPPPRRRSRRQPRQLEQVVHQPGHPIHRRPHLPQRPGTSSITPSSSPSDTARRPGERRTEVVGHERDQLAPAGFECTLAFVGRGQPLPRHLQLVRHRRQLGRHVAVDAAAAGSYDVPR